MCLIVHKPRDVAVPERLLASAAEYNPHGAGLLALDGQGGYAMERSAEADPATLRDWARAYRQRECVFHFRYRTRGEIDLENAHPLPVVDDVYLFHNGTLPLELHATGRSDSWHFARDYLAPLLGGRRALLGDATFRRMVEAAIGPQNRAVLVDARRAQVVVFNRERGVEVDGIWLSNPRWFDPRLLGWRLAPPPPDTRQLRFIG
jgi:predicted glutamine amidotransferase